MKYLGKNEVAEWKMKTTEFVWKKWSILEVEDNIASLTVFHPKWGKICDLFPHNEGDEDSIVEKSIEKIHLKVMVRA